MTKTKLTSDKYIYTSAVHNFGSDAVLLHDFMEQKYKNKTVCELGTGCGIISFMMSQKAKQIYAVDIQKDAIELLEKSIEQNKIKNITPICTDLRNLTPLSSLLTSNCDIVVINPPYKKLNTGKMYENDGKNIARFEICCTPDDICAAAKKLLKPMGSLFLCYRPERLADIICSMRNYGIEPKRLKLTPKLILLEGKKGAKSGIQIIRNSEFGIRNDFSFCSGD